MQISNLEHLQIANLEEVKGGSGYSNKDLSIWTKEKYIDKKLEFDLDVDVDVDIKKKYVDVDIDQYATAALHSDVTQVVEIGAS